MEDFLQLGPTRGFLALTSLESNEPKLIGGFHFDQSPAEARKFVEQRETDFLAKTADAKRETIALRAAQDRDGQRIAFRLRTRLR